MGGTREKKVEYFAKLRTLLEEYKSIFIVGVDNVSSQQMHEIRRALRGDGVILMGKNTMVRRAIRGFLSEFPEFERILPHVRGNVGFVFTNGDLKEIREVIVSNKVAAPARAGAVAPKDVWVPAGNTGMEPGKTSFFQALGVPTKIARGTIEITNDVQVVSAGGKVGASEATLLNMLNISPFTYGVAILQVYDQGQIFSPEILDIEEEALVKSFTSAITSVTAISLAIGYPTISAVIHSVFNHYKEILAISIATDYTFEAAEAIKDRIANPDAYAAAAPVAAAATSESAAAVDEAPEEAADESDDDMGFGLFD
ncbi:ribosomal protein L10-domain-containing protein [Lipomyces japonicus]|uniref:60S ribosomal protein uL10 n=1 Tax=Lipomyces japonicus TaxID=56871 RepID=UPI0034CF313A